MILLRAFLFNVAFFGLTAVVTLVGLPLLAAGCIAAAFGVVLGRGGLRASARSP